MKKTKKPQVKKKTQPKTKKKSPVSKKQETPLTHEEMTEKQMYDILVDLSTTIFWPAILRYNRMKDVLAITSLASTDPFKEPTIVARTQGIRTGLYMLENDAVKERIKREKAAEGIEEEPADETENYSGY